MSDNTPAQLFIRYTDPDGKPTQIMLSDKPVTIGRSPDADVITLDERASRMHCGVRIWDGEYYIKDLKSKNGTYLNNKRVEMAKIKPGDKIRLGNSIIHVDDKKSPGTDTSIDSLQNEMNEGKGYKTILREIVENTEKPAAKHAPAKPAPTATPSKTQGTVEFDSDSDDEPRTKTAKLVAPPPEEKAASAKTPSLADSKVIRKKPTAIKIKRS